MFPFSLLTKCYIGEGAASVEGELWSFCRNWKPSATGRNGGSMENDTVEFCGPLNSGRIAKRGVRSCYTLPCYALNHCPFYITLDAQLFPLMLCPPHNQEREVEKWGKVQQNEQSLITCWKYNWTNWILYCQSFFDLLILHTNQLLLIG